MCFIKLVYYAVSCRESLRRPRRVLWTTPSHGLLCNVVNCSLAPVLARAMERPLTNRCCEPAEDDDR